MLEASAENKKNEGCICFMNCESNHSQLSTSTMTQSSEPTLVYKRKRRRSNSVADCSTKPVAGIEPNNCSLSSISSQSPTMGSTEKIASLNNNCSSSKSYLQIGSSSLKTDKDNTRECSCSGNLAPNEVLEEMSERDKCLVIVRNQGPTDRVLTRKEREDTGDDKSCSKSCKVCERHESTDNLLICDSCEDAFHVSCSNNLKGTRVPEKEWLCKSCLKKKHKILKKKCKGNTDAGRTVDLGSLEYMLRDTEPYMTSVRIGDDFQADVPTWAGPVNDASDLIGEPLEVHPANELVTQQTNSLKLNSICNWLQCQEVIAGSRQAVDEPICGKWRRAPLFEVQTDGWDCFCSVLWDPTHADCAVPQEINTEEVMKQLKYVEMLRPKLVAKRRRKLDRSKSNGS